MSEGSGRPKAIEIGADLAERILSALGEQEILPLVSIGHFVGYIVPLSFVEGEAMDEEDFS